MTKDCMMICFCSAGPISEELPSRRCLSTMLFLDLKIAHSWYPELDTYGHFETIRLRGNESWRLKSDEP